MIIPNGLKPLDEISDEIILQHITPVENQQGSYSIHIIQYLPPTTNKDGKLIGRLEIVSETVNSPEDIPILIRSIYKYAIIHDTSTTALRFMSEATYNSMVELGVFE